MSEHPNIAQARAIVTAASVLVWSLYDNGDLSVDQHGPISLALGVAEMGIKDVLELTEEVARLKVGLTSLQNLIFNYRSARDRLIDPNGYLTDDQLLSLIRQKNTADRLLAVKVHVDYPDSDMPDVRAALHAAQDWIRQAAHLDDCALQNGGSCSCGKSDLTRGRRKEGS